MIYFTLYTWNILSFHKPKEAPVVTTRLKRFAAILLCIVMFCTTALADTVPHAGARIYLPSFTPYTSSTLIERASSAYSDSLSITTIAPYDGSVLVTTPDNPSFSSSISAILGSLQNGQVGAAKNVDPSNVEEGVVLVNLDAAFKSQPLDLIFVRDRSGSMNMWVNEIDAKEYTYSIEIKDSNRDGHISPHNVPCMNPDHYYLINYTIKDANGGHSGAYTYVYHPTDQNGNVTSWLGALNNADNQDNTDDANMSPLENAIEATLPEGTEIVITSIGGHYNAGGVRIQADLTGVREGDHFGFTSPYIDLTQGYKTASGCFDRSMLARHMIWQFTEQVLNANPDNRVGYTAFAGTVRDAYVVPYTNSKTTLQTAILGDRGGDQHTNYKAAFDSAATIFEDAKAGSKKVIVFVSDGQPSPADETILIDGKPVVFTPGIAESKSLKDKGAEIYAVGVNSGALSSLQAVATDNSHAADCDTAEGFISHLQDVMDMVVDNKVELCDTLGEDYTLLVDSAHPITLYDGKTDSTVKLYNTSALANYGVSYDSATRKLTYTVHATQSGVRISFYAQLAESRREPLLSGSNRYDTNETMTYTPVVNDDLQTSERKTITVDDNYRVDHTVLTAVKDNGDMKDKTAKPGDVITYTITMTNTSGMDLTEIQLNDPIPEGTTYVSGSGGSYDPATNSVNFTADEIKAGGTLTFTFQVLVEEGTEDIVSEATFSAAEAVDENGDRRIARTNEVVNPRQTDDPNTPPDDDPPAGDDPDGDAPNDGAPSEPLPETGDTFSPAAWLMLLAMGLVGLTLIRRRSRA